MTKLLAVDGTNLLYRSYHALAASGLSHAGRPVWAVHGLVLQLAKAIEHASPSHLIVAFDTPGGCPARREIDPGYKATRTSPVEDLAVQLSWAPTVLRQIGVAAVEASGWEADDLLASAVSAASAAGSASVIVTSDRDAYQLLGDEVTLRTPDEKTVTVASLVESHGVSPAGYAVLAALRGEPSDNLPGVPGVGPKIAARLVARFGSLDAIAAASDEDLLTIVGAKTLASLRENLHLAQRSARVATLRRDLPVDIGAARLAAVDPVDVTERLTQLGLASAGRRLGAVLTALR
jgi:5'-3' exonuclease